MQHILKWTRVLPVGRLWQHPIKINQLWSYSISYGVIQSVMELFSTDHDHKQEERKSSTSMPA